MDRKLALVVDSDAATRAFAEEVLSDSGGEVLGAATWAEAVVHLRNRQVRVLLLDYLVPGIAFGEATRVARQLRPSISIIAIGLSPDDPGALATVQAWAVELLSKPLIEQDLRCAAERAVTRNRELEEASALREELRSREGYRRLVGRSSAMTRFRENLDLLSNDNGAVIFTGESGTGRELAARTLHAMSPRAERPFVAVNCSTFPEHLLEVELFGNTSGQSAQRGTGLYFRATGGDLFLDGLEHLPDRLQVRLLESIRESGRGSGGNEFPLLRISAATTLNLALAADEGRFNRELYEAISPTVVHIPPLRDRREDIPVLVRYFMDTICRINNLPPINIDSETMSIVDSYHWPGNVRELRNAIEQAAILAVDSTIRPRDLPANIREQMVARNTEVPLTESESFRDAKQYVVARFEKSYLEDLLEKHRGNVTMAAEQAGMLRSALQRLLRKHSLRSSDFRRGGRMKDL